LSARGTDGLSRSLVTSVLILALALAPLCVFHGRAIDLNGRLTALRYLYRVKAPHALVGTGYVRTVRHPAPGLSSSQVADPSAPVDPSLYSLGICTPQNSYLPLPVHVDLRVRGEHSAPIGLYFTGAGSQDSYLLLDPDGELPDRVGSASQRVPSFVAIAPPMDFTSPQASRDREAIDLYHDISVLFTTGSIVMSSETGTRTIPVPGAADLTSICVAPVVSRTLSVVEQVALEVQSSGRSPSFSAVGSYHLRPLLYPLDLETKLADHALVYIVASFVFLALFSLLSQGLMRVALGRSRRRSDRDLAIRQHSLAGLLTLPAQILVLSCVRAVFGLALLPFYAVVAALIVHQLFELRHFTLPARQKLQKKSLRPAFVGVSALVFLAYFAHAASYRAGSLRDLSATWAAAAAALVLLLLWRFWLDRRVPLRATITILVQCALYAPLRVVQPALTPITFYALAVIPWVVALMCFGASSPARRRTPERLFQVSAVIVAMLLVEVAIRGDHHLDETTRPAMLTNSWYNDHIQRVVESDLSRGPRTGAAVETVELADRQVRIEKREGQLRIVCLGSSSTYGVGTASFEDTYPTQLESALLARTGRDVEVINAGVPGAMLSFLDLYLDRVLLPLDPDLVILYFGANGDSPAVAREVARLDRWLDDCARTPTPTEVWAATRLRWPRPWLVQGLARTTSIRSFVWLVNATQNVRTTQGAGVADVRFGDVNESAIERVWQESGSAWNIAEKCRAGHTPLLLVPEIMREENDPMCAADAMACMHPYYAVFQWLADRSVDDDVRYANLLTAFPPPDRRERMLDGVHMASEGYGLLAGAIADHLVDTGWLDDGRLE